MIIQESREHRDTRQYMSDRLIPLLYWGPPPEEPTLTMECYDKWYDLYLVKPDGSVKKIDWSILEEFAGSHETARWDHVPNADVVEKLCKYYEWVFHELAHEMMIGRFEREVQ